MERYPLLQTKLYTPPLRPELVSRPRLVERLHVGLHRKVTVISAPAGFGKTTLVTQWLQSAQCPSAWLSLDAGDNDPTRFLAYLVAALRTFVLRDTEGTEASVGGSVLGALQSPGLTGAAATPPSEAVLTVLINEIAAFPDRLVLVLDDYHLIESPAIHDALGFLLEHLPPQMHLVIATREDPLLPLARLRARGQLAELRATDLRFDSSEAAEFLNRAMGLDLSAEDIAALEARTEGWIAGLHLAALALQGASYTQGHRDATSLIDSFSGSHRYVLDYLVEEVLEQQSEPILSFLLQTSVLDRLSGSLCDSVTGQDDAQQTLESLEQANLFIVPLDDVRRWYRYHHLFADLLRRRLGQEYPDWVPTLHQRASSWFEQNQLTDEAIEHALRAEDFERAADLLERAVDPAWQRGEHTKLRRWLAGLPVELVCAKPNLCLFHAWGSFVSGHHDDAEQSLQAAEKALGTGVDPETGAAPQEQDQRPDPEFSKVRGRVAAFRAFMATYHGDTPRMLHYARQALECLPEQDLSWRIIASIALADAHLYRGEYDAAYRARLAVLEASHDTGNVYLIITSSLRLATILREQGRLQRVIEICQQQLQLANESGLSQSGSAGWLLAIWGEVLAETNDLDRALEKVRKGVALAGRGGDIAILGICNLCLLRVLFSRGELAGVDEIIQEVEALARQYVVPPWLASELAAWQARSWLAQDKLGAASQWVLDRGLDAEFEPTYLREMEVLVLARILIAQGQLDRATSLLGRLLETAESRGHTWRTIEIWMLQALALQAGGDTARAVARLELALTLAEPEGFVRIFVDEGLPMARLLNQAAARGVMPDYTATLLAAFETTDGADADLRQATMTQEAPGPTSSASSVVHRPSSTMVEPLSERELEVLQLIAEGLTNREIASRLFVSLNTVKAHTRNIYGKLDVHSRTQALARARSLGILPDR